MSDFLAWALDRAREHTLALVADVPPEAMQLQAAPGERHPAWLLGHLLLADAYLLSLLTDQPLADDFPLLLERYGPASAPTAQTGYGSRQQLIDRLLRTNAVRVARVQAMADPTLPVRWLTPIWLRLSRRLVIIFRAWCFTRVITLASYHPGARRTLLRRCAGLWDHREQAAEPVRQPQR